MRYQEIIKAIQAEGKPKNIKGMSRFGIRPKSRVYGVSIPFLRRLAKDIGRDHKLAQRLWESGVHEARLLAGFIDEPKEVSERQMDLWVKSFDSWDICDQVISNLFDKHPQAYEKALEWAKSDKEFVKRAGYVMMAALSVHDKKAPNSKFKKFFPTIKKGAQDERNFVKKAVNWALRQIGKRNIALNIEAIKLAKEISQMDSKAAKWIASDALRELTSPQVKSRLAKNRS